MFTVDQRNALRERVLRLGKADDRIVAGAVVGSLAVDGGDRFSDVDLTFAVADHVPVADVLGDWTTRLVNELAAVRLTDLERGPTIYRVFLLPVRPASPRFRLVFGKTAAGEPAAVSPAGSVFIPTPPVAADLFGWGTIYALHARACIERRRAWQAEHYVNAVRDHALSLACLYQGLVAVQARGYDDLPAETLTWFEGTHIGAITPGALRAALAASVLALTREGLEANLPHADVVAQRLSDFWEGVRH